MSLPVLPNHDQVVCKVYTFAFEARAFLYLKLAKIENDPKHKEITNEYHTRRRLFFFTYVHVLYLAPVLPARMLDPAPS